MVMNFCCAATGALNETKPDNTAAPKTAAMLERWSVTEGLPEWTWTAWKLHGCNGGIDRLVKAFGDRRQLILGGDEWRRDQDVVAALTVDRPAHRIHEQTARHRLALDLRVQFRFRVERRLARAIRDQLHTPEQAASADVADMRMLIKALAQHCAKRCATLAHLRQQTFALDHMLDGERGRTGDRVSEVGVTVLEESAAGGHRIDDALLCKRGADRLVASAETLGDRHQVRDDAFLFARVQRAGPPHAAHHFVENQ